jgi:ABC-type polysaccharide/polyol phosphate export permease
MSEIELDSNSARGLRAALRDLRESAAAFRIWSLLAHTDVKQRYRRSVLGPFWITLSAIVSIVALALVYTQIFKQPTSEYLVFLTAGFVVWLYLSTVVIEACSVFVGSEGIIRQVNLPLGIHVLRMTWRGLITLAHNLVIVLLVLFYMGVGLSWTTLLFVPAVVVTTVGAVALGYLLGGLCARYRDIPPIVNSLVQVMFYVTPVIWPPKLLVGHEYLLVFNPFYYFLELMRAPLMSKAPPLEIWVGSMLMVALLCAAAASFMARYRWRVAYWI